MRGPVPPEVDWIRSSMRAPYRAGGRAGLLRVGKEEMLAGLRGALPLSGMYLDIHGAMSVVGLTDAEGDLASAVRDVIGPDALISRSMDTHGNVSRRLIAASISRPRTACRRMKMRD